MYDCLSYANQQFVFARSRSAPTNTTLIFAALERSLEFFPSAPPAA